MSLLILIVFLRLIPKFKLAFSLSFIFYGTTLELLLLREGGVDVSFIFYLVSLGILQTSFLFGMTLYTGRKRNKDTFKNSRRILLVLMVSTYLIFVRDFGGITSYMSLDRSAVYGIRQGGSPLFDLFLFFSFVWAGKTLKLYNGFIWHIVLILLLIFPLALGDRRLALLLIFPAALYKFRDIGFSAKLLLSALGLGGFIYVGLLRSQSGFVVDFLVDNWWVMIPNEPLLIFNVFRDVLMNSADHVWGQSYIDAFGLLLPGPIRPDGLMPLSKWYMESFHPLLAKAGNTYAFSPVAELHLNWGYSGILITALLWFSLGRAYAYILNVFAYRHVEGLGSYWVFIFPRLSFSNALKDLLFLTVFVVIVWVVNLILKTRQCAV